MARRKGRSRSGGGRGFGGGMSAPIKTGGMVGQALTGLGAAMLAQKFGFQPLGAWTGAAAGFAVGGVAGAAAAYLLSGQSAAVGAAGSIPLNG